MAGLILSASIAGFFSGLTGALGLGGGGVLVMALTVLLGMPQLKAQGINLIFFIPVGLFALFFHIRRGLIDFKTALPAILLGLAGAAGGCLLARFFGGGAVRMLFGSLLALLGLWELAAPHKSSGKAAKGKGRPAGEPQLPRGPHVPPE